MSKGTTLRIIKRGLQSEVLELMKELVPRLEIARLVSLRDRLKAELGYPEPRKWVRTKVKEVQRG